MKNGKSAAPCEVCGERAKHAGSDRGFVVGYTTKRTPRLVHSYCRRKWFEQGRNIMSNWNELRPEVFRTLPKSLQASIRHYQTIFEGEHMPRRRSPDAFQPSPELINWVRERMLKIPIGKQVPYLQLLSTLAAEHPEWVTHNGQVIAQHVFYSHFSKVRVQTDTERTMLPSISRMPIPPAFPPLTGPPAPSESAEPPKQEPPAQPHSVNLPTEPAAADLAAMAQVAHALIDLALARHDRVALQDALEMLMPQLQKQKTTPPAGP